MPNEKKLSEVLSEFARTMVTDFPIQAILDRLVERIVDVMPVYAAGVTLISPGAHPRLIAASDDAALRYEMLQQELGEGPCVLAYQSGQAVSVGDLRIEDRFPTFRPQALEAGLRAVFTFPLRHGASDPFGALDLYRNVPGLLSPRTMAAAQTLADVAAAYLLNAEARADLVDSRDRSREAALHDGLTGLPNRALMLELLEHSLLRDRRSKRTSAVLFVDLDRFKLVNDLHGHAVGDELLVGVAHRLEGALRPGDTLARFSGDEFVVLCEELHVPGDAEGIATRLSAALAQPIVLSELQIGLTASIGIAFPEEGDHADEVVRKADIAMYQAKRQGGGQHRMLDLDETYLSDNRSDLRQDLRLAMERRELALAYQPIVRTVDGCPTGVEALLRWRHPTRGMVSPDTVIPLAEQAGVIDQIGQWVLRQSCADLTAWPGVRPAKEFGVSVNVSGHELMAAGFASNVYALVRGAQIDPHLLTLDLDEAAFVKDGTRAAIVLQDLKDIGVTLALDNFGTGYSSLIYLRQFPIDIVKIDRSIVAQLAYDPTSRTIVDVIVRLAHGIGMTVVAEGVETDGQHELLLGLACDACQGYRYARPMPLAALAGLIHPRGDGSRASLTRC